MQARRDSQRTSKHMEEHCTPWSFLQKTSWTHCSSTASGGDGSFLFHPPALPLLLSPSLLTVPPSFHPIFPSPHITPAPQWSPEEPKLIIHYVFFGRTLTIQRNSWQITMMPPPPPVIVSIPSSHPPGDCKCAQSLKQCCRISCHQAHWGQPCPESYPRYKWLL